MYYTYILLLRNGQYYHGYSEDLKKRFADHQRGIVKTTQKFLPIKLVSYASFTSSKKARSFEKYLKSSSGHAFRNKHLI